MIYDKDQKDKEEGEPQVLKRVFNIKRPFGEGGKNGADGTVEELIILFYKLFYILYFIFLVLVLVLFLFLFLYILFYYIFYYIYIFILSKVPGTALILY